MLEFHKAMEKPSAAFIFKGMKANVTPLPRGKTVVATGAEAPHAARLGPSVVVCLFVFHRHLRRRGWFALRFKQLCTEEHFRYEMKAT